MGKSCTINTLCPKIGMYQWTCNYEECTCHLKEQIRDKALQATKEIQGQLQVRG